MANEELRHKEKVEYLYANTAFPQTSAANPDTEAYEPEGTPAT